MYFIVVHNLLISNNRRLRHKKKGNACKNAKKQFSFREREEILSGFSARQGLTIVVRVSLILRTSCALSSPSSFCNLSRCTATDRCRHDALWEQALWKPICGTVARRLRRTNHSNASLRLVQNLPIPTALGNLLIPIVFRRCSHLPN